MERKGLKSLSRLLHVMIWVSMIFLALGTIVTVIVIVAPGLFKTVNLTVPLGFDVQGTAGRLRISADAAPIQISHAVGYFNLPGESRGLIAIVWGFLAGGTALSLGAAISFKRLVDSAARGEPFERGNARRVRQLGWLAMATGVLRTLYLVAIYLYSVNRLESAVITPSVRVEFGVAFIVVGILLLVLGGVFDRGEALQRDHDLTV